MTTATFVADGKEYIAIAQLTTKCDGQSQWYTYIIQDGEWYAGVGYFNTVFQAWRAVERVLGIPFVGDEFMGGQEDYEVS